MGLPEHPDAMVAPLTEVEGVRRALLLDRSGRVLAQSGFSHRDTLAQVATLVAGLHATGVRLAEVADDRLKGEIHLELGEEGAVITSLPLEDGTSSLLLLLVHGGAPDGAIRAGVESVARQARAAFAGGVEVERAEAFEASFMESLDRAFPGDAGEEG